MSAPVVHVVPCLSDNYAYLIEAGEGRAVVVDPSEAKPVREALAAKHLTLAGILATHHHLDHVGGVVELAEGRLPVVAGEIDAKKIDGVTKTVKHGEHFELAGLSIRALHVPAHTAGAIAFLVEGTPSAIFTGDTLFVAGCGRLFEGTAADMQRSLSQVLAPVDGDTRVYCGHEYTQANLRFAKTVEPENHAIDRAIERAKRLRDAGEPTVPSTMTDERATNPFLRSHEPAVRAFVGLDAEAPLDQVLGKVRGAKDVFRG